MLLCDLDLQKTGTPRMYTLNYVCIFLYLDLMYGNFQWNAMSHGSLLSLFGLIFDLKFFLFKAYLFTVVAPKNCLVVSLQTVDNSQTVFIISFLKCFI